jgi:hypothetical protein
MPLRGGARRRDECLEGNRQPRSLLLRVERIVGLRLTPNGLYRWYASCCKTPLGNTLGPAIPFVGIVARTFEVGTQNDLSVATPSATYIVDEALRSKRQCFFTGG